jgi:shikimate kinase
MGVGKSTIGRHLSELLGFTFIDTDERIETQEKCSISEIFTHQGESAFRHMEQNLVREMKDWSQCIISTGGGLVTYEDNMDCLKQSAFVVCLWASPATIYERVRRQSHRPLLQTPNPLETITHLLEERKHAYQSADLMINTEVRPMRQMAQIILRSYQAAIRRWNRSSTPRKESTPRNNPQASSTKHP